MSAVLDTTNVHLGHWINWSLGTVRGSTITLTRRDGALLTAFLAMFVTFAGTRIWKIAAFAIHLSLAKDSHSPQDALFHQRQAILRNASTAEQAFWDLLKIFRAWRKKSNCNVYRRVGPLAFASLVAGLTFAVAGIFSSQVSSAMGNEVLLTGHGCAWLNGSSITRDNGVKIVQPYNSELIQDALQRAQQCYTSNASTEDCETYVKPSIPFTVTRNASCPFDPVICKSKTANIVVDTGYLDSHEDFGVNTPLKDRIVSRYVAHCAPLAQEGYSSLKSGPTDQNNTLLSPSNQAWMQYSYGTRPSHPPINFTYEYPLNMEKDRSRVPAATAFATDYTLSADITFANNSFPELVNFNAIPELSRVDADTTLVFLSSNSVSFSGPVDDLWYSVHQGPFGKGTVGGGSGPSVIQEWYADNPADVLGCATQFQFCNPNLPLQNRCTPLMGFWDLALTEFSSDPKVSFPWRDQTEANRFYSFLNTWNSFSYDISFIIPSLGSAALSGRREFLNGFQGPLEDNQWQLDVEYWFSIQLASLQRAFAETANGPRFPGLDGDLLWPPQNDVDREFCANQKILSTNYTSFSTLGLVLTIAIGGIFITVSYGLEPALHWIQRRRRWYNYALTEWWLNETLQLQSFVHDELEAGTWTREIGEVPTTQVGERLATLDLSKPGNPRFVGPRQQTWGGESMVSSDGKFGAREMIEDIGSGSHDSFADGADVSSPDTPVDSHVAKLEKPGNDGEHHDSVRQVSEDRGSDIAVEIP